MPTCVVVFSSIVSGLIAPVGHTSEQIVHKFVEKPKEEEIKEIEVDDFGF